MFCVVVDIEDLKVGYITLSGDVESDLFVGAQTVIMLAVTMPDVGLVDKSFPYINIQYFTLEFELFQCRFIFLFQFCNCCFLILHLLS